MKVSNATLKEMGIILESAESVLLFPHINPDADAAGSCMALCRALRQRGKTAWVLVDGPLPGYMRFLTEDLEEDVLTTDQSILKDPDVCMCIDCNDEKRLAGREEAFRAGKTSLCIDHHAVKECPFDKYYIDPEAAASAQLIYLLMGEMGWPADAIIAEEIYTGINGDTGCFMHSNTTPEIHRLAADLMEYGIDINKIHVNLYQSKDMQEVRIHVRALQNMEFFADGRVVMSRISKEDFRECEAGTEHAETVINDLREINGVEVAALLKEDDQLVRCSMRSKTGANVAAVAELFGGGGHIKASGFRVREDLEEVYEKLREELIRAVQKNDI